MAGSRFDILGNSTKNQETMIINNGDAQNSGKQQNNQAAIVDTDFVGGSDPNMAIRGKKKGPKQVQNVEASGKSKSQPKDPQGVENPAAKSGPRSNQSVVSQGVANNATNQVTPVSIFIGTHGVAREMISQHDQHTTGPQVNSGHIGPINFNITRPTDTNSPIIIHTPSLILLLWILAWWMWRNSLMLKSKVVYLEKSWGWRSSWRPPSVVLCDLPWFLAPCIICGFDEYTTNYALELS